MATRPVIASQTGRANARPMTGSAKQSMVPQIKGGLLRRGVYHRARRRRDPLAPRNDGSREDLPPDQLIGEIRDRLAIDRRPVPLAHRFEIRAALAIGRADLEAVGVQEV